MDFNRNLLDLSEIWFVPKQKTAKGYKRGQSGARNSKPREINHHIPRMIPLFLRLDLILLIIFSLLPSPITTSPIIIAAQNHCGFKRSFGKAIEKRCHFAICS